MSPILRPVPGAVGVYQKIRLTTELSGSTVSGTDVIINGESLGIGEPVFFRKDVLNQELEFKSLLSANALLSLSSTDDEITFTVNQGLFDHGSLAGLGDQTDHAWALLIDGSRSLTGNWTTSNDISLTTGTLTAADIIAYDSVGTALLRATDQTGTDFFDLSHDGTNALLDTNAGILTALKSLTVSPGTLTADNITAYLAAGTALLRVSDGTNADHFDFSHDGTNAIIVTNAGDITIPSDDLILTANAMSARSTRGHNAAVTQYLEIAHDNTDGTLTATIGDIKSFDIIKPNISDTLTLGTITNEWNAAYLGTGGLYLGVSQETQLIAAQLSTDASFTLDMVNAGTTTFSVINTGAGTAQTTCDVINAITRINTPEVEAGASNLTINVNALATISDGANTITVDPSDLSITMSAGMKGLRIPTGDSVFLADSATNMGMFVTATNTASIEIQNTIASVILSLCTSHTDSRAGSLGIGTAAQYALLDVNGSLAVAITETAIDLTLTSSHFTILVDCIAAPRTITLPTAVSSDGRIYNIKKIDASANNVIIDGAGAETIDGAATITYNTQYQTYTIQSDGTEWWTI